MLDKQKTYSAYASKLLITFLLANKKDVKNRNLLFVDTCFRSRDMSLNLERKCEKKIEHFVPL